MKICSVMECGKKHRARGFCAYHFQLFRRTEEFFTLPAPVKASCSIPGCGKEHKAKRYCSKHYQALQKHGDPGGGRPQLPPRTDGLKLCSNCRTPKHPSNFNKCAASKDGLHCNCKLCSKLISADWVKENAEHVKTNGATYRQENREKIRESAKRIYWQDVDKSRKDARGKHEKKYPMKRKNKLKRRFGITLEDYDRMLTAQKGVCAICGKLENGPHRKNLGVDHNHATGKIRGLLCNSCNRGIGLLKDSVVLLGNATEYLKRDGD